jgi:hypothetical protein
MRNLLILLAILLTLALAAVAGAAWWCRPGVFSYSNYQGIQPGMTLEQVESLLGGPGREIPESEVTYVVDNNAPVGSTKRLKHVVAGERYFEWGEDLFELIISLKGGRVAEKWYWEPWP